LGAEAGLSGFAGSTLGTIVSGFGWATTGLVTSGVLFVLAIAIILV
jgi:hypothetical protein